MVDKNCPECEHICSSNCRRVGCNCECGEWHEKSGTDKKCPDCGGTGVKTWGQFDDIHEEPCHCVDVSSAARLLGMLGGASKSEAKIAASRLNGKKGGYPKGRPRKSK